MPMATPNRLLLLFLFFVALGPLLWIHPKPQSESSPLAREAVNPTHSQEWSVTSRSPSTEPRLYPVDLEAVDFRYLSHAIVDEERKLLVCAIPKVASSEWKKLFLRMQGDATWREEPWWKMRNLTTLYKVGRRRAMEILVDPTWSKGVFFRDPLKRLLSCYLDKFTNGTERSLKYSVNVFGADHTLTFPEFLEEVSATRTSPTTRNGPSSLATAATAAAAKQQKKAKKTSKVPQNVHWRPQADMCQVGLLWPFYNVHGNFERIEQHGKELLVRAGLWDEFGKSGWGGVDGDGVGMFQRNRAAHRSDYGGQAFAAGLTPHKESGKRQEQPPSSSQRQQVQVKSRLDPYAPFDSSLSRQGVVDAVMRGQPTKSRSEEAARATAALVRRVKFAYRRDYAMFASIDAATTTRRRRRKPQQPQPRQHRQQQAAGGDYDDVDDDAGGISRSPFQASLYFPSAEDALSEQPEETFQGGRPPAAAAAGAGRSASEASANNTARQRTLQSRGGDDGGGALVVGERASAGAGAAAAGGDTAAGRGMGSRGGGAAHHLDDAFLDDDQVVLRVRDLPPPLPLPVHTNT